ncbi:hypothetical protein PCANC_07419 [Puccinia coronata f. sp. avenae]|uniref:Uncharacterized protein n=1 Tax=Puccinia coronata f. sp. avenae TaxID=200324 RepID=A0A2N5T455_9BASI|nr:hypothetical protein PCANC_07419 [Puccinia coronata f. sp. avenae]
MQSLLASTYSRVTRPTTRSRPSSIRYMCVPHGTLRTPSPSCNSAWIPRCSTERSRRETGTRRSKFSGAPAARPAPTPTPPTHLDEEVYSEATWPRFCDNNLLHDTLAVAEHSFDIVIGPLCIPQLAGATPSFLQMPASQTPTTFIAFCTRRARAWLARQITHIYTEARGTRHSV